MNIQVRFFASLRERLNISEVQVNLPADATVADVWRQALNDAAIPGNVFAAVNQEYAQLSTPVKDGDEVAFFPPVTGG
jgi:sulfur-carrier protein